MRRSTKKSFHEATTRDLKIGKNEESNFTCKPIRQFTENVLEEHEKVSLERSFLATPIHCYPCDTWTSLNVEGQEIRSDDVPPAFSVSDSGRETYFVVRSLATTVAGTLITVAVFWKLGTIDLAQELVLGTTTYIICLCLSRVFDRKIVDVSKKLAILLGEHTKLRDFFSKNL